MIIAPDRPFSPKLCIGVYRLLSCSPEQYRARGFGKHEGITFPKGNLLVYGSDRYRICRNPVQPMRV